MPEQFESQPKPVDNAIGMVVTQSEDEARRTINFLRGRFSYNSIGWFYKEGCYNVLIIGKPEDFVGGEEYFHYLKGILDKYLHDELMPSSLPLEVFQEVYL
jgi:hypothetical protein